MAALAQKYKTAVYIGRFQPFHLGHAAVLRRALETAEKVIVVLGSAFRARDPKNPFTWQERADMISLTLTDEERERVIFVPVRDYYHNKQWLRAVKSEVAKLATPGRIALVGHHKDASSSYLNDFREWDLVDCPRYTDIDATTVRGVMFDTPEQPRAAIFTLLGSLVPAGVKDYLSAWWSLPYWAARVKEVAWLKGYRSDWTAPFYNAGDSVVVCSGHVLLVERTEGQGAGLFALPGGFMDEGESFYETATRELKEETNFGMFDGLRDTYFKTAQVFDHAGRSLRGRIITVAHLFDLGDMSLPEVKGRNEVRVARWVPISELLEMEDKFFEDHFHILDYFLKLTD